MSDIHNHMEKSKVKTTDSDGRVEGDQAEKSEVALREEEVLAFWREHNIFNKSLEKDAPNGDFVFYDGPPFATGLPHYGHLLAGTIKDAIPRFWTMNGYRVRRKWGWDCHGLPLENLIEKKLGLSTKRDIEEYGVKNFNEAARAVVMEYADDWRRIIPRMGRFVDMDDDYKTMDSSYTESVWWVFKSLHEKGLVYEGFKSMHLCPRCGTTLSNFEVNLGYKDIKDIAVTVKLPLVDEPDTSLLVWTTTPWTLPGNMAAAVHREAQYMSVTVKEVSDRPEVAHLVPGETYIFAVSNDADVNVLGVPVEHRDGDPAVGQIVLKDEVVGTLENITHFKGEELIGKSYQPPFDYYRTPEGKVISLDQNIQGDFGQAWKICHADYVEIGEEGTGAVHLAPAYGEEDMELAKEEGIPIVHHVDGAGHFMDFVTDFAGQLVKPKDDDEAGVTHLDADIEIVKKLKENGKLFRKENITHSYPLCWRCDTPLLNYATNSWFVSVTDIKDKLVNENNKVHWVPEHVGKNRFGKWLEGARDWAVSRQRYWGAPLPIWRNPETKEYKVFGSLKELQEYVPKSGNRYFVMRHAEASSNLTGEVSTNKEKENPLTETGCTQASLAANELAKENIDLIIHSGFLRTRETAELVGKELGLSPEQIIEDEQIMEIQVGQALQGKTWADHRALYKDFTDQFVKEIDGMESRMDVQKRVGDFLYDLDAKYQGKNILVVGHASSTFAFRCVAAGLSIKEAVALREVEGGFLKNAEIKAVDFVRLPHNDNYELDFHRPYIDDIELLEGDTRLERVPDVFDCWFESGSMPYGQLHYPFEHKDDFEKKYFPAQFIAEGLDQTRGWFYSLIVLGTALFGKSPYENVIVNGLIMAEDGKKLSKKLQNYSEPTKLTDSVGADSMRLYLLSSPVVRAEDINFSDSEVLDLQRKNIGRLHNVLAMYETYTDGAKAQSDSAHVLDRWIITRLNELIAESTAGYKNYELDKATRPVTDFIDDLSVWYLRRSRDRLKSDDAKDKAATLATLRYVLQNLALVMAPVMPFYAEYLWRQVKEEGGAESVHLAVWPVGGEVDEELLTEMRKAREFVSAALEMRAKAGIKVRQPLPKLRIGSEEFKEKALYSLIAEEVNVKEVEFGSETELDTTITPELQAEGDAREFIRAVQEMRKQEGLEPHDRIVLSVQASTDGEKVLDSYRDEVMRVVGADNLKFERADGGTDITAGQHSFTVLLKKV